MGGWGLTREDDPSVRESRISEYKLVYIYTADNIYPTRTIMMKRNTAEVIRNELAHLSDEALFMLQVQDDLIARKKSSPTRGLRVDPKGTHEDLFAKMSALQTEIRAKHAGHKSRT